MKKIIINEDGLLLVKKSAIFTFHKCKYSDKKNCGDWCANFNQVKKEKNMYGLQICDIHFMSVNKDTFHDQRTIH